MLIKIKNKLFKELNNFRKKIYLNKSENKIFSLKNKHIGERCFILGMGPSLNLEDIEKLKNEVTFACNKIFLTYEQTDWRPTYYSVADILVAENNIKEIEQVINENKSIPIFSRNVEKYFSNENVIYINELGSWREGRYAISDDLLKGYVSGTTVTYRIIQKAIYMGFKEIYLLGMDFSFLIPKNQVKSDNNNIKDPILINDAEVNHFHKDYRKKGETWTIPKLDIQMKAFKRAQEYADKHQIKIINCSRKTALDIFYKDNLNNII